MLKVKLPWAEIAKGARRSTGHRSRNDNFTGRPSFLNSKAASQRVKALPVPSGSPGRQLTPVGYRPIWRDLSQTDGGRQQAIAAVRAALRTGAGLDRLDRLKVLSHTDKNTVSPSAIAFAVDAPTGLGLAIKAFPLFAPVFYDDVAISSRRPRMSPDDQQIHAYALHNTALVYESCVYANAIPDLDLTPHVVQPLGSLTLGVPSQTWLGNQLLDALAANRVVPSRFQADMVGMHLIVTERVSSSVPLAKLLETAFEDETRSLLFQLIYTIHVMNQNEVVHHDLHFNNVLVDMTPAEAAFEYEVVGQRFEVPVLAGKLMLFDWDRAYAPRHCGDNALLHHVSCAGESACNSFSSKYDLMVALGMVAMALADNAVLFGVDHRPEATAFVKECLQDEFMPDYNAFRRGTLDSSSYRPCRHSGPGSPCFAWPANAPHDVLSAQQALELPYFDSFRV